jgi:hypothetical protein
MSAVASRTQGGVTVVREAIGSPAALDDLIARAVGLAGEERPFALLMTVSGGVLEDRPAGFGAIRRARGGRAHFGTWCRGVAYVFEEAGAEEAAHWHLHAAPFSWGTRIFVARQRESAEAWLRSELSPYDQATS